MARTLSALAVVLATSPAWAEGPINPTMASWTWPQTNIDGSELVNLKEARLDVSRELTGPWTQVAVVPSVANPSPGAEGTSLISTWGLAGNAQYWVSIRACNQVNLCSSRSLAIPFCLRQGQRHGKDPCTHAP
jgi:hypothetical protein